jgi:hypothetical protein
MPRPMPERSGNINDAIELKLADSKVPPKRCPRLGGRTEPKLKTETHSAVAPVVACVALTFTQYQYT